MSSPSPAGVTRGRRRVAFESDTELEDSDHLGRVPATHLVFEAGGKLALDYTDLPCPRLVRHLTRPLSPAGPASAAATSPPNPGAPTARPSGPSFPSSPSVTRARPRPSTPAISRAADIDAFEEAQRSRLPSDSATPYLLVGSVVRLLRTLAEGGRVPLRPDLLARLDFVANGLKGHTTPRDAYSPAETSKLRAACRADVLTIIDRLTVTGEQRLATGCEPDGRGWRVAENVMWHIDRHGPITPFRAPPAPGPNCTRASASPTCTACSIRRGPTSCRSCCCWRWRAASSSRRARTCGRTASATTAGGRVEVHYRKRRAGTHQWRSLWVRDAGMYSPGRLIRIVLRLTRRARAHAESDRLWLAVHGHRLGSPSFAVSSKLFAGFVARRGLRHDDGRPLGLQPARLRKTYKAGRYLITEGQLPDFAGGSHTQAVAGNHYGAIEALRPFHEAAVERALIEAVAAGRSCTVLTAEEEEVLAADPALAATILGIAPAQVQAFLGGEQDVWLSSCRDFFDSPFGTPGSACPTPFWACLGCTNAVITTRKLPALLSFLAHMLEARTTDAGGALGRHLRRGPSPAHRHVLPRFPPAVIAAARAAASVGARRSSISRPSCERAGGDRDRRRPHRRGRPRATTFPTRRCCAADSCARRHSGPPSRAWPGRRPAAGLQRRRLAVWAGPRPVAMCLRPRSWSTSETSDRPCDG